MPYWRWEHLPLATFVLFQNLPAPAHYTQLDFYMNALNRYNGYDIELLNDTPLVQPGDTIACCQEKQMEWMKENYKYEEIVTGEIGCALLRVDAR